MPVTDLSGNGIVRDVGGASHPGYSLWMANANGDGAGVPWAGGAGTVIVTLSGPGATLGGGTVNVKTKFPGKNALPGSGYITADNADQLNITAAGTYDFRLAACEMIASLTGATNPVGVCVAISGYDL